MQGQLIIGAILIAACSSPAMAVEQPSRQTCSRGEQPQQQARQPQQRQQWAQQEQQQQRAKPHGCPVYRSIPSVVDPTPTFLL